MIKLSEIIDEIRIIGKVDINTITKLISDIRSQILAGYRHVQDVPQMKILHKLDIDILWKKYHLNTSLKRLKIELELLSQKELINLYQDLKSFNIEELNEIIGKKYWEEDITPKTVVWLSKKISYNGATEARNEVLRKYGFTGGNILEWFKTLDKSILFEIYEQFQSLLKVNEIKIINQNHQFPLRQKLARLIDQNKINFKGSYWFYYNEMVTQKEIEQSLDDVISQISDDPKTGTNIFGKEIADLAMKIYNLEKNV